MSCSMKAMGPEGFDVRKVAFGKSAKYAVYYGKALQTRSGLRLENLVLQWPSGKVITQRQKAPRTFAQQASTELLNKLRDG